MLKPVASFASRPAPLTPDAALTIRLSGFDQAGIDKRLECEDRSRRIAACCGDGVGAADRLAVEFGDAINESAEQLRRLVRMAVPALVGRRVVEPEVGAEVDELNARVEDDRREPLAMAMRKCGEHQVDAVERRSPNFSKIACG